MTDDNWTGPKTSRADTALAGASVQLAFHADGNRCETARGRNRLIAAAIAAGGMAFLAGGADAAAAGSAPEGYTPASGLADIASLHVQADGSVELVMTNGQSVTIAASDVLVEDGIVYFLDGAVDAALDAAVMPGVAAGGGAGMLLGAGLLGGVAAAAGGGGGGSSTPAPTPPTPPTNANPPVFTSASAVSVDENATGTVYTAAATDADGNTVSFSIVSGGDSGDFSINSSTGALTFVGTPDFENPDDSNADNAYEITIRASDGTNTTDLAVTITVDDVDEAPVFSSGAEASVAENQTAAYTAAAADDENSVLSYSLSGTDAALFSIDSGTGLVSFRSAPDYENPEDAGGDNVYDIVVSASDGTNTTTQAVAISVTDQNDNSPVFTSAATASVAENQTSAYDAEATDADAGSAISYSLSGTDASLFAIDADTGVVSFVTAPDFEAPADTGGDNVYDFVVTASDGANTTDQAVAVTVTNAVENGDLPADQSTPATLALGGTFSNQLETVGDRDWIAVELVAGQRYAISLTGTGADPLSDPLVRIYDASGNLIGENDDGGPGLNSLLSYTAPTTGTYYVEAAAWDDTVAGSYTVGLETAPPLRAYTNDEIAEYLRSGYWVGNGSAARHWNVTDGGTITVNIVDLTADGQTLARAAMVLWSDLTGITFAEVATGGQIVFDDDQEGAFATASTSGGIIQSAEVNVSADWIDTYGTDLNSYSYQTYIHEIGHALGLGHAGPYNGSADYVVDAAYLNDSWQVTVMSYFSQTENSYIDASFAFVVSPQIADILAIQSIYGLAANIRGGNTVYGFNSTAGNAIYDATSFLTVTAYTIVDTGGTDTMDYSGSNADQTLDLRAESYSSVQGGTGNVGIARGTVIERAIGGTGDDILIGNAADNRLTGNDGNDSFYASGGSDVYNGNSGTDTVFFSGAAGDYAVTVNGSGNTVVTDLRAGSPDGVTELISIETIQYGVNAPSLMAELSDKSEPGPISQDTLGGASVPVMDVLMTDTLDLAEKPVDHHDDVMPSLTAGELGQVQAIDGGAAGIGEVLSEDGTNGQGLTGPVDTGAGLMPVEWLVFNLPEVSWGLDGLAILSEGGDRLGAEAGARPAAALADLSVFQPEALPPEEMGGHHPIDAADGWA